MGPSYTLFSFRLSKYDTYINVAKDVSQDFVTDKGKLTFKVTE